MTVINVGARDFLRELDFHDLAIVMVLLALYAIVFVFNAKALSEMLHRFLPKKLADHFDNTSVVKDVFGFCAVMIVLIIIAVNFYLKLFGIKEAIALVIGLAASLTVIKKPLIGYIMLGAITLFVVLEQGLFAGAVAVTLMILPRLLIRKKLPDMLIAVAVMAAVTGYYYSPLFAVFVIALSVPSFVIAYHSDIGRLMRKIIR